MESITVSARELRKGDILWLAGGYWEVGYICQADCTSDVETVLASRQMAGVAMQRRFHPSEQVRRRLRQDDPVYKVLYGPS